MSKHVTPEPGARVTARHNGRADRVESVLSNCETRTVLVTTRSDDGSTVSVGDLDDFNYVYGS